jgi:hypothetical protein
MVSIRRCTAESDETDMGDGTIAEEKEKVARRVEADVIAMISASRGMQGCGRREQDDRGASLTLNSSPKEFSIPSSNA